MNIDNLLMISFVNQWTPLTQLLQKNVECMAVDIDSTTFKCSKDIIPTNFHVDMYETNCVYQHIELYNEVCFKVYHK